MSARVQRTGRGKQNIPGRSDFSETLDHLEGQFSKPRASQSGKHVEEKRIDRVITLDGLKVLDIMLVI